MRFARRTLGMTRVILHLARGAGTLALVFPLIGADRRRRAVKRWADGVLDIFGLTLKVEGPTPLKSKGPLLLVGNHVSWVDIYAFLSVAEIRFVAKSEVRSWPLIGWFASSLGTIFVERERPRDAIRVGGEVRTALDNREIVCIFPEGTTTDGSVVLPFSSVLLGAAAVKDVPVQPVSIAYRTPDGQHCTRAAFTGDATLVGSLWELAGGGASIVELKFLDPIDPAGHDRRTLARLAEDQVRASLGYPPQAAADPVSGARAAEGQARDAAVGEASSGNRPIVI